MFYLFPRRIMPYGRALAFPQNQDVARIWMALKGILKFFRTFYSKLDFQKFMIIVHMRVMRWSTCYSWCISNCKLHVSSTCKQCYRAIIYTCKASSIDRSHFIIMDMHSHVIDLLWVSHVILILSSVGKSAINWTLELNRTFSFVLETLIFIC